MKGTVLLVGAMAAMTCPACSSSSSAAKPDGGGGSDSETGSPDAAGGPLTGVVQISSGGAYSCAVLEDSSAVCWGDNTFGELGTGTTKGSFLPVAVPGLGAVASIATAANSASNDATGAMVHTCALMQDGTVECWGQNEFGQLGDGTTTPSLVPVAVKGLSGATMVSSGTFHTCAVLSDSTVKCWGDNAGGALGNGTYVNSSVPVAVTGLTGAKMVSTGNDGSGAFTCALLGDGSVKCWGDNTFGNLGNGVTGVNSNVPVTVSTIVGATDISARNNHACAIVAGGTVKCWGYDGNGELGDGSTADSSLPVESAGVSNAISVAAGSGGTCVVLADGTEECWGLARSGGLVPVRFQGVTNLVELSLGAFGTCSRFKSGVVLCVGDNSVGELGDGTNSPLDGGAATVLAPR